MTHSLLFVGAENLSFEDGQMHTNDNLLKHELQAEFDFWWTNEGSLWNDSRQSLLDQHGSEESAKEAVLRMIRWMTLREYIDTELDDEAISREEEEGWIREWRTAARNGDERGGWQEL